jgi:hypothetical protein
LLARYITSRNVRHYRHECSGSLRGPARSLWPNFAYLLSLGMCAPCGRTVYGWGMTADQLLSADAGVPTTPGCQIVMLMDVGLRSPQAPGRDEDEAASLTRRRRSAQQQTALSTSLMREHDTSHTSTTSWSTTSLRSSAPSL